MLTSSRPIAEDSPPISIHPLEVPRKPKVDPTQRSLTNGIANGHVSDNASFDKKRKRSLDDDDDIVESTPKKGKIESESGKDKAVIIDDGQDSAILID